MQDGNSRRWLEMTGWTESFGWILIDVISRSERAILFGKGTMNRQSKSPRERLRTRNRANISRMLVTRSSVDAWDGQILFRIMRVLIELKPPVYFIILYVDQESKCFYVIVIEANKGVLWWNCPISRPCQPPVYFKVWRRGSMNGAMRWVLPRAGRAWSLIL